MQRNSRFLAWLGLLAGLLNAACGQETVCPGPYAKWAQGFPQDAGFFPIAVWLQSPAKAQQYRDAGINTYVALWRGPTEEQLAALKKAGMKLICHQNTAALKHRDDPTIIGWMHGDEPDNAQSLGEGKGYGPPIAPAKIVQDYEAIRAADSSRPVMLNLGQGVAWDGWHGRGVRSNHPEDYPEYLQGCDIASFDIYPVAHSHPDVSGKLWFVARGVELLGQWSGGKQVVWNCIECTRIQNPNAKATPHQVKCEVWMSLIHGSQGLIYFVHEWQPKFNESALLSDPEMLSAVTAINRQILRLAPVLHSPTSPDGVRVSSDKVDVPVAVMAKQHASALYVFAVGMRDAETTATFTLAGVDGGDKVEVLDEDRKLTVQDSHFQDHFGPWDTHLYRIAFSGTLPRQATPARTPTR
jgi:hypothetical protein